MDGGEGQGSNPNAYGIPITTFFPLTDNIVIPYYTV